MSYDKELFDIRKIVRETGCWIADAKIAYKASRCNAELAIKHIVDNKKNEADNVR